MRRSMVVVLAGVLVLSACGDSGSGESGADETPAGSVTEATDDPAVDVSDTTIAAIEIGPVTVTPDESAAVTATIGIDGGTISAVDTAGTTYDLVVPAGSLAADTEIVMTPADLGGVPFPTWTVTFGPTGLEFIEPASLSITTADPIPVEEQFFYQLNDDATEFGAVFPDSADETMAMQVRHFSGYGAGRATENERAALLEKQASDAEAALESKAAERINAIRNAIMAGATGPEVSAEALDDLRQEYVDQVITPRLQAASSSCSAASLAVRTVLGFERMNALLGIEETQANLANLADVIYGSGSPCEKEAIAKCKAAQDPAPLIKFWLEGMRLKALLGTEPTLNAADLVKKATKICKPVTYTASGSEREATFSGDVASYTAPFNINVAFIGGNGFFVMTPDPDGLSGTIIIEAGGSGVSVSGGGTYTAVENPDGTVTLQTTTDACVEPVGACEPGAVVITLTPKE